MAGAWTQNEVELVVADYFAMLQAELLGQHYNKTEHRRRLIPQLNQRNDQSIEFKHANISAVLVEMHQHYIDGYKPRYNYQNLLRAGVESFLLGHPNFFADLLTSPILNPTSPGREIGSIRELIVPPPERRSQPTQSPRTPIVRTIDFVQRDAENRKLGQRGEEWVLVVERTRLLDVRRDDLAKRIEWVSSTRGDGLGFDILSFNHEDETERHIEVKTTTCGKFFPFYVSSNEVKVSESEPSAFHLYRVFGFGRDPKLYILKGPLSHTCQLEPIQFRATV